MAQPPELVVCLSHLRWNFVYQRPQHLMSRCARDQRVVFFEEPVFDAREPELELRDESGVTVAVPTSQRAPNRTSSSFVSAG